MNALPDTSFLYALYRQQENSPVAVRHFQGMSEPLAVTSLLLLEFRQSLRFQVYLRKHNRKKGISARQATKALAYLGKNLSEGALLTIAADWSEVQQVAERLSRKHTQAEGHRLIDILHVATALHFGAREFLTFDANQTALAKAEGLRVTPIS